MASLKENIVMWGKTYKWDTRGHEWSTDFGGTCNLWNNAIWPRLLYYLPSHTVLEIGCGYGRWADYLIQKCSRYIGVDINTDGLTFCKQRYSTNRRARFYQVDGQSLSDIETGSVSLVFSFDSLVHADA